MGFAHHFIQTRSASEEPRPNDIRFVTRTANPFSTQRSGDGVVCFLWGHEGRVRLLPRHSAAECRVNGERQATKLGMVGAAHPTKNCDVCGKFTSQNVSQPTGQFYSHCGFRNSEPSDPCFVPVQSEACSACPAHRLLLRDSPCFVVKLTTRPASCTAPGWAVEALSDQFKNRDTARLTTPGDAAKMPLSLNDTASNWP